MTNRKTQSMNNNNKMFHGFENCASRLTLLNYSRKPHELRVQRTQMDKDESRRLNKFPQRGKTKHKAT